MRKKIKNRYRNKGMQNPLEGQEKILRAVSIVRHLVTRVTVLPH